MRINNPGFMSALGAVVFVGAFTVTTSTQTPPQTPPAQPPAAQAPTAPVQGAEGYAWSDACRKCHQAIHTVWGNTKHARALNRLSRGDQEKECIGCHVTGPKTRVEVDGDLKNGGIQCESCHGPSAAHVADPTVKTPYGKKPPAKVCTDCHNEKSPHFRGFYYDAMIAFSHRVQK